MSLRHRLVNIGFSTEFQRFNIVRYIGPTNRGYIEMISKWCFYLKSADKVGWYLSDIERWAWYNQEISIISISSWVALSPDIVGNHMVGVIRQWDYILSISLRFHGLHRPDVPLLISGRYQNGISISSYRSRNHTSTRRRHSCHRT